VRSSQAHLMPRSIRKRKRESTHQTKLLNPNTKIHTPVNCTASAKLQLNASINAGNAGANAKGPNPCVNVTMLALTIHASFHGVLQLSGSSGASEGCGTRTVR
jgi:hypothetical protein